MVERRVRSSTRRPLPPPPSDVRPVPHTTKKPVLASTGIGLNRLCAICLGKLEPGMALTFCECGKFFHLGCISELGQCPICGGAMAVEGKAGEGKCAMDEADACSSHSTEIIEVVYQCPICGTFVPEDSETCACGAVFDNTLEEVYLCPGCGAEVDPDSPRCSDCGLAFAK